MASNPKAGKSLSTELKSYCSISLIKFLLKRMKVSKIHITCGRKALHRSKKKENIAIEPIYSLDVSITKGRIMTANDVVSFTEESGTHTGRNTNWLLKWSDISGYFPKSETYLKHSPPNDVEQGHISVRNLPLSLWKKLRTNISRHPLPTWL